MIEVLGTVNAVLVGKARPFGKPNTYSAINKKSVNTPVYLNENGLAGDEQGDLQHHGGIEKAVHLYAFEHYQYWENELGALPRLKAPGAFGENISTVGISEENLFLGDRLKIGSAIIEVSQGRRPCWKLNEHFCVPDMVKRMQKTLLTGWYCRVIQRGYIQAGDEIQLILRTNNEVSIKALMQIMLHQEAERELLTKALLLPIKASWKQLIERKLMQMS